MGVVTIHNLEVRFEVQANEEEQVFARLFQRNIEQWSQVQQEEALRHRQSKVDGALGDAQTIRGADG